MTKLKYGMYLRVKYVFSAIGYTADFFIKRLIPYFLCLHKESNKESATTAQFSC